jgi:RNA polymerase sigma factor (sigma-70 family)
MTENAVVPADRSAAARHRFERLYAEHHPHVFGYVMRRCSCAEDAADAIAETFLVAWRRLDDAPAGEQIRLWLYGVARRVLANQRRGQKRHIALAEQLGAELSRQPTPLAVSFEQPDDDHKDLRDALLSLSSDDRELLMLEAWEELNSEQIGTVLGCSAGAARTRLHRARRRLHDALERVGHTTPTSPHSLTAEPAATNPAAGEI